MQSAELPLPLRVVLDTNVAIDWLVFDHPFMTPLREGLRDGRACVLSYEPAIAELRRVLGYPALKLAVERREKILAQYLAHAHLVEMPADFTLQSLLTPAGFPRCRDPDDQHFLALAFHTRADALVSRDAAVLKLRKRARKFGVPVLDVQEMIALLERRLDNHSSQYEVTAGAS